MSLPTPLLKLSLTLPNPYPNPRLNPGEGRYVARSRARSQKNTHYRGRGHTTLFVPCSFLWNWCRCHDDWIKWQNTLTISLSGLWLLLLFNGAFMGYRLQDKGRKRERMIDYFQRIEIDCKAHRITCHRASAVRGPIRSSLSNKRGFPRLLSANRSMTTSRLSNRSSHMNRPWSSTTIWEEKPHRLRSTYSEYMVAFRATPRDVCGLSCAHFESKIARKVHLGKMAARHCWRVKLASTHEPSGAAGGGYTPRGSTREKSSRAETEKRLFFSLLCSDEEYKPLLCQPFTWYDSVSTFAQSMQLYIVIINIQLRIKNEQEKKRTTNECHKRFISAFYFSTYAQRQQQQKAINLNF